MLYSRLNLQLHHCLCHVLENSSIAVQIGSASSYSHVLCREAWAVCQSSSSSSCCCHGLST